MLLMASVDSMQLVFCATGAASGFILNFTNSSLSFIFSLILPIPSKTFECICSILDVFCFEEESSLIALTCVSFPGMQRLFGSANEPSSLICNIPSSVRVDLLISGGESILPFYHKGS